MAEGAKTQWLIRGTGHWIMAVVAWFITLLAGDRLMDAIRGERDWFTGILSALASAVFWIATLRGKRGQD